MRELKLKPGEKAPEFTLKNQYGQEVSLSSLKGKKCSCHSTRLPGPACARSR